MNYQDIVTALKCGRSNCVCKRTVLCHCPNNVAHKSGDNHPSLSVNESGGRVLFRCHAGCQQDAVIAGLKRMNLWQVGDAPRRAPGWQLVKSYEYRNESGALVAEHGRFDTGNGKAFAWRVPGKTWKDGLAGVSIKSLPMYRLNDVLESGSQQVWLTEGEKAADACHEHGLISACLGGGANQSAFGNALDPLRDREVILWPDNDEPGRTFMSRIAELLPQSRYVRPVVEPKGDAWDYFESGGTTNALFKLVESNLVVTEDSWIRKYEGAF
jgi:hypothetical protein